MSKNIRPYGAPPRLVFHLSGSRWCLKCDPLFFYIKCGWRVAIRQILSRNFADVCYPKTTSDRSAYFYLQNKEKPQLTGNYSEYTWTESSECIWDSFADDISKSSLFKWWDFIGDDSSYLGELSKMMSTHFIIYKNKKNE